MKKLFIILTLFVSILTLNFSFKAYATEQTPLPIIMYHSVLKNKSSKFVISTSELEKDFIYIKNSGYTPITMNELISFKKGEKNLPVKPIIITFDDGFYNNYTYLYPLLKKYNFKAVISVVGLFSTEFIEPPFNPNYSYLTFDLIKKMGHSGFVEIQNHTYKMHSVKTNRKGVLRLKGESDSTYIESLRNDFSTMQKMLKEKADITATTLTYPFGLYSKESQRVAKELGFEAMLTCEGGINYVYKSCNLDKLKRYNRSGNITSAEFFRITKI